MTTADNLRGYGTRLALLLADTPNPILPMLVNGAAVMHFM